MTPAIASWLLAVPYILTGIGFCFVAWAAGGLAHTLLARRNPADSRPWYYRAPGAGLFLFFVRIASGFAMFSWLAAMAGVIGWFNLPVMLTLLFPVLLAGMVVSSRFSLTHAPALLRDRLDAGHHWVQGAASEKFLGSAVILAFCIICVNSIVGALVPDMNHDPMWYHLSVPQQWVFSGRFDAYPNVMQSAFPLAAESLFAIILLVGGDPVMCSLLSVCCGIGFFFTMVSVGWTSLASERNHMLTGWGAMAVLAICVPLSTMYGLIAPIPPKNDIITMYCACAGAGLLVLPVMAARRPPALGWWIVGGFLLGTACSAKPPVLSMTFFVLAFAVGAAGWYERKMYARFPRAALIGGTASLLMMGVAALPWMIRGYLSHGVPLYPVGTSFFPVSTEFLPLDRTQTSIQEVPGLSWADWWPKLLQFPERLAFGANHGERFAFIYMLAGLGVLIGGRGRWRWYGAMLLVQLVFLVGISGGVEVFRLFSPTYALAAPAVAWLVAEYVRHLRLPIRVGAGALVWISIFASIVAIQVRLANYRTFQWEFRPVLSELDVREYATHAEKGFTYLEFGQIRSYIDQAARVLLLNGTYPFYLHRDTLWNDEAVREGGLAERWSKMSADQARTFLQDENIDVILYAGPSEAAHPTATMRELLQSGVARQSEVPDELKGKGWALYHVTRQSANDGSDG